MAGSLQSRGHGLQGFLWASKHDSFVVFSGRETLINVVLHKDFHIDCFLCIYPQLQSQFSSRHKIVSSASLAFRQIGDLNMETSVNVPY